MKRKSIYKIILRVLLFCLVWRLACTAGAITAVTAYLVFRTACFLFRVCLSVFYALCVALLFLLAVAFPIKYMTNIMQSLNRNGVSITQAPGEEKFVKYRPVAFKGRIFYQYDYRHTDGELFPTVAKTLAECRHRRDKWIEKKEQGNSR